MGIAKLYGQKASGIKINGIIKDYHVYAGENVSTGDLVEYINGIASARIETSSDTVLENTTAYSGQYISAVQLDEDRVFIAHSSGTNYYLHGVVVTISGTTITIGTDTQLLYNTANVSQTISTVALDSTRVFIAHNIDTGSSAKLCATICTISGTTITATPRTSLSSSSYTGTSISAKLLENGNVFVCYSYGSSYYLYGMVVTVGGTNITAGSATRLQASNYAGYRFSLCLLPNGNVFVAHSLNSNPSLYALICTISGTTITSTSSTQFITSTNSGAVISTVLLPSGNVFVVHSDSSDMLLYGFVCTINGTSMTKEGMDSLISSSSYAGATISTQLLSNGKVFIAHSLNRYYLYGIIATIDGSTVTVGTDTQLSTDSNAGRAISSALLLNGTIFIAHSYTSKYHLYAQVFGIDEASNIPTNNVTIAEYEKQVRKTTTSQFDGVAKTSGIGGTTTVPKDYVSVYTLDTNFVTRDGNAIMTADKNTFITKQ